MVSFTKLSVRNFKRFSGHHDIPLRGDGRVTVIAAENGVGKTTLMEAIHIALYGNRAFNYLYPKEEFEGWLESAFSVDGEGDKQIMLALEMEDPILGPIRVSRTFWLMGGEFGLEQEITVEVSGKPLERESGETRTSVAEKWVEDYLPHSAMRKFLVDGERLSHLNPKLLNDEVVRGIDDVIGIGLLHRIDSRLEYVRRGALRAMTPKDQEETLERGLEMLIECEEELTIASEKREEQEERADGIANKISEIQDEIERLSMAGGNENVQLRMRYAVRQSELTSSRKEVHQLLMSSLPFVIAGVPRDPEEWGMEELIESKKSSERMLENLEFLKTAVVESDIDLEAREKVVEAGLSISQRNTPLESENSLSLLSRESLESILSCYSALSLNTGQKDVEEALGESLRRLEDFEIAENDLREATAGSGIGQKADELKSLATELGSAQAEVARLKGVVEQCKVNMGQIEEWIGKLKQNDDPESTLNRRISRASELRELCALVTDSVRSEFSAPLEEAFAEGFELLSRKSGKLESVEIDTSDYSVNLAMRGFEGNWLDRGLSATERQHVGLALVYALRRSSTKWSLPLPVVVDTPTSRMDRRHKGWSVTKFYPQLSNQVIVFATSDDLSDGLFEELSASGSLGLQHLISEVSDNSVKASPTDLGSFFGR